MAYSTRFGIRTRYGIIKRLLLNLIPGASTYIRVIFHCKTPYGEDFVAAHDWIEVFRSRRKQKVPIEYCFVRCLDDVRIEVRNENGTSLEVEGFKGGNVCRACLVKETIVIERTIPPQKHD